MKNNCFSLFSNCILVNGFNRSAICDIQLGEIEIIPNDLKEVISLLQTKSINEVCKFYGSKNKKIILEYINYLLASGYGFYSNKKELILFPRIENIFHEASIITNIVIELRKDNLTLLKNKLVELERFSCKNIAIIFYEKLEPSLLIAINSIFDKSIVTSIHVFFKYDSVYTYEYLKKNGFKLSRVVYIHMFSAPFNKKYSWDDKILFNVTISKIETKSFNFCGQIISDNFFSNSKMFFESKNHNSCLNRKIAIDIDGNIKNCPAMPKSFGNIKNSTLEEALNHKDFKKYWNITKDQIDVCKDCEFRYVCTDCRAYIEKPDDIYSKPLKCGYSPYTNKWEEWSTNPLKQKAIEYYGMQELVKIDNA